MRAISNNSLFYHDLTDKFAVYDKFPKTAVHVTDRKVPIKHRLLPTNIPQKM